MPTDLQQALDLIKLLNDWAYIDISLAPAAVAPCTAPDHPATLKTKAAAKDFFLGRPVDVIEGHGSDPGAYEFEFDFAIALDAKTNTPSACASAPSQKTPSLTSEACRSQTITWSIVSGFKGLETTSSSSPPSPTSKPTGTEAWPTWACRARARATAAASGR